MLFTRLGLTASGLDCRCNLQSDIQIHASSTLSPFPTMVQLTFSISPRTLQRTHLLHYLLSLSRDPMLYASFLSWSLGFCRQGVMVSWSSLLNSSCHTYSMYSTRMRSHVSFLLVASQTSYLYAILRPSCVLRLLPDTTWHSISPKEVFHHSHWFLGVEALLLSFSSS